MLLDATVGEALDEVRDAVRELTEASFTSVDELVKTKEKLTAALHLAHQAGATPDELLEAGKVKVTDDIEKSATAGVVARKARKLRLLEKAQLENKLEEERTQRVAQALVARRARAKSNAEEKSLERSLERARNQSRERSENPSEEQSEGEKVQRSENNRPSGPESVAVQLNVKTPDDQSDSIPKVRRRDPETSSLRFRGDESSDRSRSPRCQRGKDKAAQVLSVQAHMEPGPSSLATMLGRGEVASVSATPITRVADVPIGVLATSVSGGRRLGSSDLTTGGGEICFNFSVGMCSRWGCKFKHVQRN